MDPIPAPLASNNTTASTSSITGVALLMMKKDQAGRPAALLPLRLSLKRARSESDPCETVTGGADGGERLAFLEKETKRAARSVDRSDWSHSSRRAPCLWLAFRVAALYSTAVNQPTVVSNSQ